MKNNIRNRLTVNVTFHVNMQYQDSNNGVYISGGNIGSSLSDTPSMGHLMNNNDGDTIYSVTLALKPNTHYTYKYRTGESLNWEGNWENVPAECGKGQYTDRYMDTGSSDMTLDPVCFGSCEDCSDKTVNVTFNLDMSGVETSPEGVYLAGGGTFGVAGDNPMSDEDGNDIWTIAVTLPSNLSTDYTFLNGNCADWSCKEDITGQDCTVLPYNDRHIDLGTEDVTVNACFAVCGDGICGDKEITIDLDSGWNMISNPTVWNKTIIDPGLAYPDTLYNYLPLSGYLLHTEMIPNKGYWIYASDFTTITLVNSNLLIN
jgi:hypothetical protein